jgi:hypothetical protein
MKRSYVSKRRKRGAPMGNQNADGIGKFLSREEPEAEATANREIDGVDIEGLHALMSREEGWQDDFEVGAGTVGLEGEIRMMRFAMRKLMRMAKLATTLGEMMKATQILSLAGDRLASMLLAHAS